jgi:hypothetical protein
MMDEESGKKAARIRGSSIRVRPIVIEMAPSSPRYEDLSATPDLSSRAAWVLMLDDSIFTELCRIREEFIRATRAGDSAIRHYLIDFANEICLDDSVELSSGVTVDMDMEDDETIDQAAIDANAKRFLEDLLRKEQAKNGANPS